MLSLHPDWPNRLNGPKAESPVSLELLDQVGENAAFPLEMFVSQMKMKRNLEDTLEQFCVT